MNNETNTPNIPSIENGIFFTKSIIIVPIKIADVAITSFLESLATASSATESISFPTFLLNNACHILTRIEIANIPIDIYEIY